MLLSSSLIASCLMLCKPAVILVPKALVCNQKVSGGKYYYRVWKSAWNCSLVLEVGDDTPCDSVISQTVESTKRTKEQGPYLKSIWHVESSKKCLGVGDSGKTTFCSNATKVCIRPKRAETLQRNKSHIWVKTFILVKKTSWPFLKH